MFTSKKGQVTFFVVLGIIVIMLIGIVAILSKDRLVADSYSREAKDIKSNVEYCNNDVARGALILLGAQGGRYKSMVKPIEQDNEFLGKVYLSHFIYGGEIIDYSLDDVEKEINDYYKDELLKCLNNFDDYKSKGIKVEAKEINVDVEFLDDSTRFILNYDVIIERDGSTETLDQYVPADVPYRFKKVFDVAIEATKRHVTTGNVPVVYVMSNDLVLMNYNAGTSIIYRIVDQKDDEERKYAFYFAVS